MSTSAELIESCDSIKSFHRLVGRGNRTISRDAARTFIDLCVEDSDAASQSGPMFEIWDQWEDDNGTVIFAYPRGAQRYSIRIDFQRPFSQFQLFVNMQKYNNDVSFTNCNIVECGDVSGAQRLAAAVAKPYTPTAPPPVIHFPLNDAAPPHTRLENQVNQAEKLNDLLRDQLEESKNQLAEMRAEIADLRKSTGKAKAKSA
jgi:hypothetical protein